MNEPAVAIVGMSGRFPGARGIAEFWANLRDGVCSISDFTDAELLEAGVDPAELANPNYVPAKGHLAGAGQFEPELFGFNPTEAAAMDPQHRLLLETAWAALEDAGYNPHAAPRRTGVYVGGGTTEHMIAAYRDRRLAEQLGSYQAALLSNKDLLALWISYRLGLTGPSLTVQSACSTSLVSVHLAAQALLLGECDTAIAGGVSVESIRKQGYLYYDGGILSPDGRCRPFDEKAAGTVPASGVGLVVLRRLDDALDDGDPIRAVIRGSAVTNDGAGKVGFTAPSVDQQTATIVEAWTAAGLDPASAQYFEAHGTGTSLGDRIEVAAASAAFGPGARCGIGSVKSNIGHCDAAAGVAGLIKVVLMLSHQAVAPTVNVSLPHPDLRLDRTPFYLADRLMPWERPDTGPRRAGVSSLGVGGTNVHVVVEQAPDIPAEPDAPGSVLLPLSARTGEQVTTAARRLADALRGPNPPRLRDVAYTLRTGRAALPGRGFVVAADRREAITALDALAADRTDDGQAPVFVFPGQASHYPALGAGLYAWFDVFRRTLDTCAGILLDGHGIDPRPWRAPDPSGTRYWQPTLVAIEYALAQLWRSRGVTAAAMIGHSIGEFAAACVAGVLSLPDALGLAAVRGELMDSTRPGRMLAVTLPETRAAELLGPQVWLAAVNGPRAVVLAGTGAALGRVADRLAEEGTAHRYLDVDRAFHSPLMEPILARFAEHVSRVELAAPELPYVSTATGTWITAEQATDPTYWVDHITHPIRYAEAVSTVDRHAGVLLELGPGNALTAQAKRVLPGRAAFPTVGAAGTDEVAATLRAFGELWSRGYDLDLPTPAAAARVHLPTYPFAGQGYGAFTAAPAEVAVAGESAPAQQSTEDTGGIADIVDVLSEALSLSGPQDLDQTYFGAGGDSLTAVHIVGRLRDDLGIDIPVTLFLEQLTVRELASRIAEARTDQRDDTLLESLLLELESE